MPFLFETYQGQLVPNEGVPRVPSFDCAWVTVSLGAFLVRVFRGRGELDVKIAPRGAPTDWCALSLVVAALDRPGEVEPPVFERRGFFDLPEVAEYLEPRMSRLNEMFSRGEFDAVRQRVERQVFARERAAVRDWKLEDWQAEISRRRYGR